MLQSLPAAFEALLQYFELVELVREPVLLPIAQQVFQMHKGHQGPNQIDAQQANSVSTRYAE
jgi:hypothetical protein